MEHEIETVIVGGGQAGLASSYFLSQKNREHIVLEQAEAAGNAWRNGRWDSFTLVTPNWTFRLPGAVYNGAEPDGFMPRDEIVAYLERYTAQFRLPVQYNTRVVAIEPDGAGYLVRTQGDTYKCANAIIATGLYQKPKLPPFAANLPDGITQLHSSEYRQPDQLPPGAVVVVGFGQSGGQIAEELNLNGRTVYLCVGKAPRAPRQYRGKDIFRWLDAMGFLERKMDSLPSSEARFASNPTVSGARGGHTLNLHQFARDGIRLLGRLRDIQAGKLMLAPDLRENLTRADQTEADIAKKIDAFIDRNGLDAPEEQLPQLHDGFDVPVATEVDLAAENIGSIVWASGYVFDYSMVKLPAVAGDGFPVQQHGVTQYPGLYFVGMPWMPQQKTGILLGVGDAAAHIVEHIVSR